jgi:uncharacterized protein
LSSFFVDTSALAKRYLTESGTRWVRGWTRPSAGHEIILSDLALVEMFSVLARHERMGLLSTGRATRLRSAFVRHLKTEYISLEIDRTLLHTARRLVSKHSLRTLDAIQLASALKIVAIAPHKPIMFISADNNLLSAATAEGFNVDNPNNYP